MELSSISDGEADGEEQEDAEAMEGVVEAGEEEEDDPQPTSSSTATQDEGNHPTAMGPPKAKKNTFRVNYQSRK